LTKALATAEPLIILLGLYNKDPSQRPPRQNGLKSFYTNIS